MSDESTSGMSDDEPEYLPEMAGSKAGKAVILGIFGLTLAMSVFAVWYRQAVGRRARELFGIEAGQRLQLADDVALVRLPAPVATLDKPPEGDDLVWLAMAKVSGMTHVRGALIEDRSFDWEEPGEPCPPQWQYVLRFRDRGGATHLALDLQCARLRVLERQREVGFAPMATFLRRFITSQFPGESADETQDETQR
ncbi:MAG: hypothetical protein KDB14_03600 [Planctomycetales bacterium]|nr:hypothetical protein [Planctomycetales bacterium]